jgi:hypothetical protein
MTIPDDPDNDSTCLCGEEDWTKEVDLFDEAVKENT